MKIIEHIKQLFVNRVPHWNLTLFLIFLTLLTALFVLLKKSRFNTNQKTASAFLLFYFYNVLITTLFMRKTMTHRIFNFIPLSSFITPHDSSMLEFLFNILLFIPIGFLINCIFKKFKPGKTVLIGLTSSLIIEMIQFAAKVGEFETDDIISNTLGAFSGCLIYFIIISLKGKNKK